MYTAVVDFQLLEEKIESFDSEHADVCHRKIKMPFSSFFPHKFLANSTKTTSIAKVEKEHQCSAFNLNL